MGILSRLIFLAQCVVRVMECLILMHFALLVFAPYNETAAWLITTVTAPFLDHVLIDYAIHQWDVRNIP